MNQKRECGVLLPVSSLPSKYTTVFHFLHNTEGDNYYESET